MIKFRLCTIKVRLGYKINDKWNLNFTGYKYDIEDMVADKTAGELGLAGRQWFRDRNGNNVVLADNNIITTNIDEAEIQGYELGARGKLSDSFNLALSYTNFKKAEDKATKVRLESVPDYRATMALEYCHEKTTAVLSLSHQGKTKARPGNNVTTLDSSTLCIRYENVF